MVGLSLIQLGLVGVAGAAGALTRYLLGRFIAERVLSQIPVGTFMKATRKLTGLLTPSPLARTVTQEHVDVQDDVLLPEGEQKREARRPR